MIRHHAGNNRQRNSRFAAYSLSLQIVFIFGYLLQASALASSETSSSDTPKHFSWQISSLEKTGIAATQLDAMLATVQSEPDIGITSALLVYQGALVFEHYFAGWDAEDLHTTRSASKAITSALVGIAIEQGYVKGVDATVLPFFPEYDGKIAHWDDAKRKITLHHLLSMTSGVRGNEDAMYPTDDWLKFYLDQPLAATPGAQFSYATSGVVVLGSIIKNASSMRVPKFADKYLFKPMGINKYRWPITNSRGNQGLAMTGGGLNLTPRDMAKFGLLYLNKGVWNGQQLISPDWIELSTSAHATSNLYGEDFGYLWRMIDRDINGTTIRSFEAWGNGGQFIMVFPQLELVAVWTGENFGQFPKMERPFALMDKFVLPLFIRHVRFGDGKDHK